MRGRDGAVLRESFGKNDTCRVMGKRCVSLTPNPLSLKGEGALAEDILLITAPPRNVQSLP